MNTMAPDRPPEPKSCRVRLTMGPAGVPEARSLVRAAVRSWEVSVDPDDAALLTSELVTNAVQREPGQPVVLVITSSGGQLRVDVHDTSHSLPAVTDVSADAETGRGLLLVATLSAEWGCYPTPTGKAVYFTLACQAQPASHGLSAPPAGDPVQRSSGSRAAVASA